MSLPLVYSWPAANTQDVCLIQNIAGAGNLILNGNLLNQVNLSIIGFNSISRTVSLTSANNLSGVNFTISGYFNGTTVTTTIAGPNANTVYTAQYFDSITSVSASGAANGISVGSGTTGFTKWFRFDYHTPYPALSIQTDVTNSPNITYSFQTTLDDVNSIPNASLTTFTPIAGMTGANTSQFGNINYPIRYARIAITASTNGSLTATFIQQGVR